MQKIWIDFIKRPIQEYIIKIAQGFLLGFILILVYNWLAELFFFDTVSIIGLKSLLIQLVIQVVNLSIHYVLLNYNAFNTKIYYHDIIDSSEVGIIEFDSTLHLTHVNTYAERFILPRGLHKNGRLSDYIDNQQLNSLTRAVSDVKSNDENIQIDLSFIATEEDYTLRIVQLKNQQSQYLGIIQLKETHSIKVQCSKFMNELETLIDNQSDINDLLQATCNHIIQLTKASYGIYYRVNDQKITSINTEDNYLFNHARSQLGKFKYNKVTTYLSDGYQIINIPLYFDNNLFGNLILSTNLNQKFDDFDRRLLTCAYPNLQKKVERQLQLLQMKNELQTLELILDSSHIGTFEYNLTTGTISRSKNHEHVTGSIVKENKPFHKDKFINLVHPDDKKRVEQIIQTLPVGKKSSIEYRIKGDDNQYRWVLSKGILYKDSSTNHLILNGITINIDDQKNAQFALQEVLSSYQELFEFNPAPLLIFDSEKLYCLQANEAAKFLYGFHSDEWRFKPIAEFQEDHDTSRLVIPHDLIKNYGYFRLGLWKHKKGNGQTIFVDLSISSITYNNKKAYLVHVSDVTHVINSQQALSKSEEKYRSLFEQNPQPILLLNQKSLKIFDLNRKAIMYFNAKRDDLLNTTIHSLFSDEFIAEIKTFTDKSNSKIKFKQFETNIDLNHSNERIVNISIVKTQVDNTPTFVVFIEDITVTKQLERQTILAFIEGEDVERERIAKELHDGLGQVLSAASMNLKATEKEIKQFNIKRKEQFSKGITFIQQAIEETRNISHNLMPKSLHDYGLISSINALISSYKELSDIKFDFNYDIQDFRLDKFKELNIYRIIQEAISNVFKYAKAKHISININVENDQFELIFRDDGVGMSIHEVNNGKGLGLRNMKSRVKIMNGEISIHSKQKEGTQIYIKLPIS